jgi:hypothetical protein
MFTKAELNNLFFFIKRVPTDNLQEAALLVSLAERVHQELTREPGDYEQDSPRTAE